MKNLFLLLTLLLAAGPLIYSQTAPADTKKPNINRFALEMPPAVYPEAAKHQCIAGEVEVLIKFTSDGGRPFSAEAVSGDELLRDSAVAAAKKAVFKATETSINLKISGILLYKFAPPASPRIVCLVKDEIANKLVRSFPNAAYIKKLVRHKRLGIKKETAVKVMLVVAESGKVVYASAVPGSGYSMLVKYAEMLARRATFWHTNDVGQVRVKTYLLIKFQPSGKVSL